MNNLFEVFSFSPHGSYVVVKKSDVIPIPDDISFADAAFLPSMETAVSLVSIHI